MKHLYHAPVRDQHMGKSKGGFRYSLRRVAIGVDRGTGLTRIRFHGDGDEAQIKAHCQDLLNMIAPDLELSDARRLVVEIVL